MFNHIHSPTDPLSSLPTFSVQQPMSVESAYDHWLIVFTFSVLYTIARWGAALLFGAVSKRTADSAPLRMRSQVAGLVGLVRLAGSLLGPILVSVFHGLFLVHATDSFYFGWAFVICVFGFVLVMFINGILLWRKEMEKGEKEMDLE